MKTLAVSEEVWEALRDKGHMGQSFDRLLRDILNLPKPK